MSMSQAARSLSRRVASLLRGTPALATRAGCVGGVAAPKPRMISTYRHYQTATQSIPRQSVSPFALPVRSMFIQTAETPNPDSLKFHPDEPVLLDGGSLDFASKADAQNSPLARKLFTIEGVNNVFLTETYIAINKDPSIAWTRIKPFVFATIEEFYASGHPIVTSRQPRDTDILDTDTEVVQMIKELLETRIRPTVQEDGGDIAFVGFDEDSGVVSLKMQGSCAGCPSSSVTLKQGIEGMLMHYIPEVMEVQEVVDEAQKLSLDEFQKTEAKLAEMRAKQSN